MTVDRTAAPRRRADDHGFTLVELMVAVLVIAILLAIALPTLRGAIRRSNDASARSTLRNALAAELQMIDSSGNLPGTTEMNASEPRFSWTFEESTGPGVVSAMVVNQTGVSVAVVSVRSKEGDCFAARSSNGTAIGYATLKGGGRCKANTLYYMPQWGDPAPVLQDSAVVPGANGHGYQVVISQTTFAEAKALAASLTWNGKQGHLVTITSAAEEATVHPLIDNIPVWTAARYDIGTNTWMWDAGPESGTSFFEFASDPNGAPIGGAYVNTRSVGSYARIGAVTGTCGTYWFSDDKLTGEGCTRNDRFVLVEYE